MINTFYLGVDILQEYLPGNSIGHLLESFHKIELGLAK